ncbi:pyridoxal phosphate-dependent aminotransferase [Micropruina sp.]|uniref:pyridoxal phosphate-dependent aminotransferase n=1 Tax=Micropruina sp. TaxID=2737536 RepID=UPI0039E447BA
MTRGPLNRALEGFTSTIFAEMSALAVRTASVNLGQGFPDFGGPDSMLERARQAIADGVNQYPPGPGDPTLRSAIAAHQQRFYDIELDPDSQVLVTAGATEGIAAAMLGLLEPGDEVVLLEPYYDSYAATIALAGGVRRPIRLEPPDFALPRETFAAAINPRTRLLLINSPHNPTGAVLSADDLAFIAELAVRHDVLVVTDEVYEHLTYDGVAHLPLSALPGMAERTVTLSSAGKTFSATGWKIGWATGPDELVAAVRAAKQFLTYVNGAPFQPAIAEALQLPHSYFDGFRTAMQDKRDRLIDGLTKAGIATFRPRGTYFVVADARSLGYADGYELCRALPELCGVVAVPMQVFYDNPDGARHLVRFAYCKRDEVLDEAVRRLGALRRD